MFGKITDAKVRAAKPREKQYKISDGNRLSLVIFPTGAKTWRLTYTHPITKKEQTMSLGEYPVVGLTVAREKAMAVKKLLDAGIDPIEDRRLAFEAKKRAAQEKRETLEQISREWLAKFGKEWAPGHEQKMTRRLELYLFPKLGKTEISKLKPFELLKCTEPLVTANKTETAYRLVRSVSQVMRYAVSTGRAERDVTLDLKGALPSAKGRHLGALTKPREVAGLLKAIEEFSGKNDSVKNALRLAPHVFLRPGELRQIRKEWVHEKEREIVIPAKFMKTRHEHVVPLSERAAKIVNEAMRGNDTDFLFPSPTDRTRAISNMALLTAIRRMGYEKEEMTAHGFRALASTNLEQLGFDIRIIELQLAHADTNSIRAAYKRDTSRLQISQRREMMNEWSNYLDALLKNA